MEIETRKEGTVTVFTFHGPVTREHVHRLTQAFCEAMDAGDKRFIFSFAESVYMDSASIGETVACLKRVKENDGELKLVVPSAGKVRHLLELVGLARILDLHEDEAEALRKFTD